jgi:hypothetical protein
VRPSTWKFGELIPGSPEATKVDVRQHPTISKCLSVDTTHCHANTLLAVKPEELLKEKS